MNLGIVIYPTVQQMIITIGKSKGIDVKLHPKFRDATSDQFMNAHINEKLGKKDGKPIPFSAMKSPLLPKAEDVSKQFDEFMKMGSGPAPNPAPSAIPAAPTKAAQGLLNKLNLRGQ